MSQRVLLVDDEVLLPRTLSSALRKDGCDVFATSSAEEAEPLLGKSDPMDVLVLDVKLQGRSGLDLLGERRGVRFLDGSAALTAFGNPVSERVCRALAADHSLRKPLDVERLLELVRSLANGAGNRTARAEGRATA